MAGGGDIDKVSNRQFQRGNSGKRRQLGTGGREVGERDSSLNEKRNPSLKEERRSSLKEKRVEGR